MRLLEFATTFALLALFMLWAWLMQPRHGQFLDEQRDIIYWKPAGTRHGKWITKEAALRFDSLAASRPKRAAQPSAVPGQAARR